MEKMTEFLGEMVPEELCTVDRFGGADDFCGCGNCFDSGETTNCENCVVNRIFQEYALLTCQNHGSEVPDNKNADSDNKNTGFDPKNGCIVPEIGGDGAVWVLHGHWNMPDDSGVNIWGVSPDMELLQKRLYETGEQMVADALDSPQEVKFDNIETSETKYEAENSEGYFIRLYITLNDVDIGKGRHK